ncbi:hypothetical protein OG338_10965 [Streptomyces sp. NBC_00726]
MSRQGWAGGRCTRDHRRGLDYTILAIYFVVVLGIGFAARASVKTSLDFFLSGRSLPAWVTGLAMLALGLFFLAWMKLRPAQAPEHTPEGTPGS